MGRMARLAGGKQAWLISDAFVSNFKESCKAWASALSSSILPVDGIFPGGCSIPRAESPSRYKANGWTSKLSSMRSSTSPLPWHSSSRCIPPIEIPSQNSKDSKFEKVTLSPNVPPSCPRILVFAMIAWPNCTIPKIVATTTRSSIAPIAALVTPSSAISLTIETRRRWLLSPCVKLAVVNMTIRTIGGFTRSPTLALRVGHVSGSRTPQEPRFLPTIQSVRRVHGFGKERLWPSKVLGGFISRSMRRSLRRCSAFVKENNENTSR